MSEIRDFKHRHRLARKELDDVMLGNTFPNDANFTAISESIEDNSDLLQKVEQLEAVVEAAKKIPPVGGFTSRYDLSIIKLQQEIANLETKGDSDG